MLDKVVELTVAEHGLNGLLLLHKAQKPFLTH